MKANRKFKQEDEAVSAVIGVILMVAITVAIAATVYVYVSGMLGGPTASAPKISWVPDMGSNSLTITKGVVGSNYGASSTSANLVFQNGSTKYYVHSGLNLTNALDSLSVKEITAGDKITGFVDGTTYTLVWVPTNEVMGTITY